MVTWMIVWMRRHARGLAGDLRANAASALARGSWIALVGMAFFAVLREGIETAVFLLAAFQASADPTAAGLGAAARRARRGGRSATASTAAASASTWRRFFRLTAARAGAGGRGTRGQRAAHRARGGLDQPWQDAGARPDLARPARHDRRSALLTGMLGIQPHPTVAELIGWLAVRDPDADVRAVAAAPARARRAARASAS